MKEIKTDSIDDLDTNELEQQVEKLMKVLKKRKTKGKQVIIQASSKGSKNQVNEITSIHMSNEDSNADKKDPKFLNKQEIDLLFPEQIKSYYASSEF